MIEGEPEDINKEIRYKVDSIKALNERLANDELRDAKAKDRVYKTIIDLQIQLREMGYEGY